MTNRMCEHPTRATMLAFLRTAASDPPRLVRFWATCGLRRGDDPQLPQRSNRRAPYKQLKQHWTRWWVRQGLNL
jgi:hypothetical protein